MTRFKGKPAIDPATNLLVKDGSGQVYAVTDTAFATPLEVTDTAGLPLATISTGPLGIHQDFDTVADHLEVVWKSGPYTVTLESSEGIAAAAAAGAAQPAADAAAITVRDELSSTFATQAQLSEVATGDPIAVTDQAVNTVLTDPASAASASLSATYGPAAPRMRGAFPARPGSLAAPVKVTPGAHSATNPAAPLTIPSPYPSDDVVHPSVVFAPDGWNGYRYWMGYTPYPGSDSSFENPCIVASQDGQTWEVPPGLTNPLQPDPGGNLYYSDTHLVFGPDGTLHLFYRLNTDPDRIVYHQASTDGVTWTAKVASHTVNLADSNPASPAVVYDADGTWVMWYVENVGAAKSIQKRTATSPDGPWSAPTDTGITPPAGKDLWHLDVQLAAGSYLMLLTVTDTGSSGGGQLWLLTSEDGNTWQMGTTPLLTGAPGTWATGLYRGSLMPTFVDGALRLGIWYSAQPSTGGWRIGYTETATITGGDDIFLRPDDLTPSAGAPTLSTAASGRVSAWLLDAAAAEQLQTTVMIPDEWTRYDIYLLWTNAGAGAGDVVFGHKTSNIVVGETLAAGDSDSPVVTVTAPAENMLVETRIRQNLAAPTGRYANLRVLRRAADAGDTLTNDIAVLGIRLVRA